MSTQNPKRQVLEAVARVGRALGSGPRLELLELLAQSERSVETLSQLAGLNFGNASQHLQQLRRAGLVTARRDGKRIYYSLNDEEVVSLVGTLRRIAERNVAEVERVLAAYFDERDSLEPVSRIELMDRMHKGLVTILDVRPAEEFANGHVPGALNIAVGDLDDRRGDLPTDREIIAYCRGPYCVLSFEAVAILRRRGFEARRLEDGFPEWKLAGLPTDSLN